MPRVHIVKKARKDYPHEGIKKDDSYYWWKFNFGPKVRSLVYPKPSQLTRSEFLSEFYGFVESFEQEDFMTVEDIESRIEELKGELENMQSELEDRLQNMPEHLQEASDSGMILQERIDGLDSIISDLDGIDTSFDVEDLDKDEDPLKAKGEKVSELKNEISGALDSAGF